MWLNAKKQLPHRFLAGNELIAEMLAPLSLADSLRVGHEVPISARRPGLVGVFDLA